MKHIIKTILFLLALTMGATGKSWAVDSKTENDLTVRWEILPGDAAGTVEVSIGSDRKVTLTVTPATGYKINKEKITVEKMINPSTRGSNILADKLPVSVGSVNATTGAGTYTFDIPAGANGAYVTVTFFEGTVVYEQITSLSQITNATGSYEIISDIDASSLSTSLFSTTQFKGKLTAQAKADGTFPVITGLRVSLFKTATDATISNIMLKSVTISQAGYVGAICGTADGTTRIYNCGILPTDVDNASNRSTVTSTNNHCGSLVGFLDGYARVINCFSYANVSAGTGNNIYAGGLVGYNKYNSTQQGNSQANFDNNVRTMVVNCMFYGDITQGSRKRPVYGGNTIANNPADKVNNYNYYSQEDASFESGFDLLSKYNYSWPVARKYLTRFEVYRSILNSNRRLCTWWVNGTYNTCPTDDDVEAVGIAKWVLDQSIAPYPILKKWGKYYSSFDIDPDYVWNPKSKTKVLRTRANAWEGKSYGTLSVTIKGGTNNSSATDVQKNITITDMDSLGYDYCVRKIQLPYYNEIFGNPNGTTWAAKYGNNYTTQVVTGWKIKEVTNKEGFTGSRNSFSPNWQDGYNFADRNCTDKDIYSSTNPRVFAQGGYYYVPDNVQSITIEAYWGDAVYLCNNNRYLDRVNNGGSDFYISGQLPDNVGGANSDKLKTSLSGAVGALTAKSSVYDQAIVLVGNYQNNAFQNDILYSSSSVKPFTMMSADFDFDNEPDFCFQAGMYNGGRPNVQPIRFDFLMVPDITMAIRTNKSYYGMRIFCPSGHFEITETSYLYTTQFEYDRRTGLTKKEAPVILNGGEHMQIVSTEAFTEVGEMNGTATANQRVDRTSYFLMGGKVYMKAFTPGAHGNRRVGTRHCAVNAIGGEFTEFYLSGMFRTDFYNMTDNPHAYLDGGRFGIVAGAGMESVGGKDETDGGDVTFKINHSLIREFYGGGINANRPVTGNIDVYCDNSIVHKYCGGPKLGDMSNTKSITTNATNTTFDEFYGGGNGGTNMLRDRQYDAGSGVTNVSQSHWDNDAKFSVFNPFDYDSGKGYQAEYEFEALPKTDGKGQYITRSYYYWASFSKTKVAPVTNIITDCIFNTNFYGGGNLGAVDGPSGSTDPTISSTLKGNTVVHGSVYGAGFSASNPSFKVHDKSTVSYPYVDVSGYIHDGSLKHDPTDYIWINDIPTEWEVNPTASSPKFTYDGKWYCYTPVSMEGLGMVTGNVTLNIEDYTVVMGHEVSVEKDANGNTLFIDGPQTGGVFGGGDSSGVVGNITVNIDASGQQSLYGYNVYNVFGGGDNAGVDGNSKVTIKNNSVVSNNVFGGGNKATVSGTATVNIGSDD